MKISIPISICSGDYGGTVAEILALLLANLFGVTNSPQVGPKVSRALVMGQAIDSTYKEPKPPCPVCTGWSRLRPAYGFL